MSKFDEYEHYRTSRNGDGESQRHSGDYEDISSDFASSDNDSNKKSKDFSNYDVPFSPENRQRKFFDDTLLKDNGDTSGGNDLDAPTFRKKASDDYDFYKNDDAQVSRPFAQRSFYNADDFHKNGDAMKNKVNPYMSNDDYDDYSSGDRYFADENRNPRQDRRDEKSRSLSKEEIKAAHKSAKENGVGGKKKKKKKRIIKIIAIILIVALLFSGCGYAVFKHYFGDFNQTDLGDVADLGISSTISEKYGNQKIINFALFGTDTRDEDSFEGRSDSIMIVSVNVETADVKIISILRDSYVAIDGYKNQKITHAYMYGGAKLAINTINKNFDMNISDYATINFTKMGDVIDTIGGLDIEITEFERNLINGIGTSEGRKMELVYESGLVHLNGDQAVSYARIRSDSDEMRAKRQRIVMTKILETVKSMPVTKYPSLCKTLMSFVETSMSYQEILGFAPLALKSISISQTSVPDETLDKPKGGTYDGTWVWRYDLKAASQRIHEFIYEDGTTETTTVAPKN